MTSLTTRCLNQRLPRLSPSGARKPLSANMSRSLKARLLNSEAASPFSSDRSHYAVEKSLEITEIPWSYSNGHNFFIYEVLGINNRDSRGVCTQLVLRPELELQRRGAAESTRSWAARTGCGPATTISPTSAPVAEKKNLFFQL